MKKLFILFSLLFTVSLMVQGQTYDKKKADSLLKANREVYFKFSVFDRSILDELTNIISIDNVHGNEIYAYANKPEFENFVKLGYDITILTPPGSMLTDADLMQPKDSPKSKGPATWNFYPTYQQYVDTMEYFANTYPAICKLDTSE